MGDVVTFINGRAYSQEELLSNGKYKVLRVGNFYTNDSWYYSDMELEAKYYAKEGDLLYTWSATFGPHIWHGDKVIYHYHIWKVELSDALEKHFAVQLLEKDKQSILSDKNGSTMVHITKAGMESKEVMLPPNIREQTKIGECFQNLDNLITLHQRKYLQKKKTSLTWEQRKLGEIVERVTRKNQDLVSELPLTISAQYGLIDQNIFFDKRVASKDVSGYYLIYNGEFAYNKSTSSDAPWGAIKRLDRYENGVLSTLYIVFKIKDDEAINSDFLVTYYDTCNWHKDIKAIAAEGARNHGLLNIAPTDFFKTELMLPQDIEEQKKIGSYFKLIDHLITLHRRAHFHRRRRTYK